MPKLYLSETELAFHISEKASNSKYPKLPRTVLGFANSKQKESSLTAERVNHMNSCIMGFKTRVHNFNNEIAKAVQTQPKPSHFTNVDTVVEQFWGE